MDEAKVMEVLRRVEWFGRGLSTDLCPWCRYQRGVGLDYLKRGYGEGHADNCKLAALLREGEKEKAEAAKWSHAELYIKALEAVRRAALLRVWHCESTQTTQVRELDEALGMADKARERYREAVTGKGKR